MRRIALFIGTNIAVLLSIAALLSGIDQMVASRGYGGMTGLLLFAAVFGLFASMIVIAFSCWRGFHAEAAGAKFAGRDAMVSALQRLQGNHGESTLATTIVAFGISGPLADGFKRLLMSDPPLEERIAAAQRGA